LINSLYKAILSKKALIIELLIVEIAFLIVLQLYKYYINFNAQSPFSGEFLRELTASYNFFYAGNLVWLIIFLIALAAIINLYVNIDKVNDAPLRVVLLVSLLIMVLLALTLLFPKSHIIDEFTGKFIQLNAKGSVIASMGLLTASMVFLAMSLAVISFSALKKYYVFRSVWLSLLAGLALISIAFFLVYFYRDDQKEIEDNRMKFDAGVILGAAVWGGNRPSPILRERINKGYELYKNGVIKNVVLTGGGAPGEMTEAEVSKSELMKKGIEEKYVFTETQSNTTLEQIRFINSNLYQKYKWDNIILISDNFHLFRAKQICNFFNMKAYTVSSDTPLSAESDFSFCLKESFAVLLFWLFGIG
jgi:uncharacterized SAM-binding protein YcdF (DUF218 family)